MRDEILTALLSWFPATVVLAITGSLFAAIRRVMLQRRADKLGTGWGLQLAHLFVVAAGAVVFVLSMPITVSVRGQLLNLMGILATAAIALSSTTFVGNAMAGLMLKVMKKFQPGDFVRVQDQFGRVTEMALLHTEIQTEARDLATLPNLMLVGNPVTVVRSSGTVVSVEISLGYDVPRHEIEKALLAAVETAGLRDGFVHIRSLGDFSVVYRVSAFLEEVKTLITTRSRFYEAVLDQLHASKIEIVSPTFMNQRVLPEKKVFIPPRPRAADVREGASEETTVEEKIFDKADEAETRVELKADLEAMISDKSALEKSAEQLLKAGDEAAHSRLLVEVEALDKKIADLQQMRAGAEESKRR